MDSILEYKPFRSTSPVRKIPSSALLFFLLITLAITWGITGSYIFLPEQTTGLFGALEGAHPLYFLATWGPGIAGLILVLSYGGWHGLRAFLVRLAMWPKVS